jgi:predicted metal-dependent peptidase
MARKPQGSKKGAPTVKADEAFHLGMRALTQRALFGPISGQAYIRRWEGGGICPRDGWAVVTSNGEIHVHPSRLAQPAEWEYVMAHCLLHLALDHFRVKEDQFAWNCACDAHVHALLTAFKVGSPHCGPGVDPALGAGGDEAAYRRFREGGVPEECLLLGTAGGAPDMVFEPPRRWAPVTAADWQRLFSQGVAEAAGEAVRLASGVEAPAGGSGSRDGPAERARRWFVEHYPLLGALAARMRVLEDGIISARLQVSIAAVSAELEEIYVNPMSGLGEEEWRFVLAHEMLHVGLRHHARCHGRDPFLWNVACDYVINGWLVEMGIGRMPTRGVLHDRDLAGLSAESIYDRIVTDIRRARRLATLRGAGLGDMLEGSRPEWWETGEGLGLDDFYRRSMLQGLEYHTGTGRGLLPAGLVEEVRALSQPPIPWDVEMAHWFDPLFAPVEKRRSYARLSRRQSATPEIPRPSWVVPAGAADTRTFGVVLDTSGSMSRADLARALGAIAGTCFARDIPAVRVVFADAAPYDQGYLRPEDLQEGVTVTGRGGTVLQPAVKLLEEAADFPPEAPILIITDGQCDRLTVRRTHAYLLPRGRRLPYAPEGPVFEMR